MVSTVLVGGTGLVGSYILHTLINSTSVTSIVAYTRNAGKIQESSPKLHQVVNSDSSQWGPDISALKHEDIPQIFFSALGTTKAAAGGVEKQRKIDFDLNLLLAKAAKEAGIRTYILISGGLGSGGTESSNSFVKMKADLEIAVKELGFERTVIVKPGLIVGNRKESRPIEAIFRGTAKFLGAISGGFLKDAWAQDADVIARATVKAGLKANESTDSELKVWNVEQKDILALGRKE